MQATVTGIHPEAHQVDTDQGSLEYDDLIVALGSVLVDDPAIEGFEAPWELDHAIALRERLRRFNGGHVVVGPLAWPYRCPPAPFEVAFMLKYLADQRHAADRTRVTVFHPWQDPMQTFGPQMVEGFRKFLTDFGVGFEGAFTLARHDRDRRVLVATDGRTLEYDFAVIVPAHRAPDVIRSSPLATAEGYMDVVLPSMRHPRHDHVWGIGDVVAPTIG